MAQIQPRNVDFQSGLAPPSQEIRGALSKNTSSQSRGRGRPKGSKNKKSSQDSLAWRRNSKYSEHERERIQRALAQGVPKGTRGFSFQDDHGRPATQVQQLEDGQLANVRMQLEAQYMENWQENKRMRKKPDQMNILQDEFDRDPNWNFKKKMEIASAIGMTPNQVSKWNWDQRKKLGMSTERKKKAAAKK